MSSEYLEDVSHDEHGSTVLLSMKASGDAFLYVSGSEDGDGAIYHLAPNESGWRNAEKIVTAINAWIEHTKRINLGV